jgi:hypothetical protein
LSLAYRKSSPLAKKTHLVRSAPRTLLGSQGGEVEVGATVDLLRLLNERLAHVCLFYFAPFLSWVVHWFGLGWMETYLNTLCGWIGLK